MQPALAELPVGVPGHGLGEVDAPAALVRCQRGGAMTRWSGVRFADAVVPGGRFLDGLDLLQRRERAWRN